MISSTLLAIFLRIRRAELTPDHIPEVGNRAFVHPAVYLAPQRERP